MKKILSVIMFGAFCNVQSAFNNMEEFKKSFERQNVWTQAHSDFIAKDKNIVSVNDVLLICNDVSEVTRYETRWNLNESHIPVLIVGVATIGIIMAAGPISPIFFPLISASGTAGAVTSSVSIGTIAATGSSITFGGTTLALASTSTAVGVSIASVEATALAGGVFSTALASAATNSDSFVREDPVYLKKTHYTLLCHFNNEFFQTKLEIYLHFLCNKSEESFVSLKHYIGQENYIRFLNGIKERKQAQRVLIQEENSRGSAIQNEYQRIYDENQVLYQSFLRDIRARLQAQARLVQEAFSATEIFSGVMQRVAKEEFEELFGRHKIAMRELKNLQKIRAMFKSDSAIYNLQSVVERQSIDLEIRERQINSQQNEITHLTGMVNSQNVQISSQWSQISELVANRDIAQAWSIQQETRLQDQEERSQQQFIENANLQATLNNLISNLPALIAQHSQAQMVPQALQIAQRPGTYATAPSSQESFLTTTTVPASANPMVRYSSAESIQSESSTGSSFIKVPQEDLQEIPEARPASAVSSSSNLSSKSSSSWQKV